MNVANVGVTKNVNIVYYSWYRNKTFFLLIIFNQHQFERCLTYYCFIENQTAILFKY